MAFKPTRAMKPETYHPYMEAAEAIDFAAGIPNFHVKDRGGDSVGECLMIKPGHVERQDVPLASLGGVDLLDVPARIRAANTFAGNNKLVGGFPTFHQADYGAGVVCGTLLFAIGSAEFRDIPLGELGEPAALDYLEGRFRATNDWAISNGFAGGFPTLFEDDLFQAVTTKDAPRPRVHVFGAVLLRPGTAVLRDVVYARRAVPPK